MSLHVASGNWGWGLAVLLFACASAFSATPQREASRLIDKIGEIVSTHQSDGLPAGDIPPLAPPLPEIPSTFWERHPILRIAFPGLVTGLALGLWQYWANRKKIPPQLLPPAAQARAALTALQAGPEDGATLSQVSQVLRRYLINTFWLRPEEMTTTEFCAALGTHREVGSELAAALCEFLRSCDERKFSPVAGLPLGAARRALELVELAEAGRAKRREATPATQNGIASEMHLR